MSEDYKLIQQLANKDARVLQEKGKTYGDSWRKRGGVGAFMMLSRKWDRIENIAQGAGYDIFVAGFENTGDILDDIADLRRYLLLVEAHIAEPTAPTPKPLPVCPECWKDALTDSTVVYCKGECPIHDGEDCGPGAGYVNQDGPGLPKRPWSIPEASPPTVGSFDVIQVMWNDDTYSSMLRHEFGKIAEWSEVKLYRVVPDGTDPEDFPLPGPVRQWGGSRCPVPHVGDHQHTISPHDHIGGSAQPSYSHTNGFGIIAGIASAVSGFNGAAAAMSKP